MVTTIWRIRVPGRDSGVGHSQSCVSVGAGQLFVSVILIITLLSPIVIIPTTVINVFLALSFQSMLNCAHYSNEAN